MLKVLIESDNNFLSVGIRHILEHIFNRESMIIQTPQYKYRAGEDFDLYFFDIEPEEDRICHTRLLYIPIEKSIFFLTKRKRAILFSKDNKCIERGQVIRYEMSILDIEKEISKNKSVVNKKRICCSNCKKPFLTPQEIIILKMISKGLNPNECSSNLHLSETEIYAHINNIKKKLKINGKKSFYFTVVNLNKSTQLKCIDHLTLINSTVRV